MFERKCLLSQDGKSLCTSTVYDCDKCGWAADVERRRKDYVRRYGLRTGKDGLLYIPARPEHER